jgi:hypothetical protein
MDPDPAIFVSDLQNCLKVHLHNFSKIKSHKEFTKQWESMFFLLFLLDDRRIRIRISDQWIRIRDAQNIWIRNTA